jgi:acetolactate synthase-1/3 small subunit
VRQRAEVLQLVDLFRAHVVDVTQDSLVIEAVGTTAKLEAFMAAMAPHEIKEIVQSGIVAIGRGNRSITERPLDRPGPSSAVSE